MSHGRCGSPKNSEDLRSWNVIGGERRTAPQLTEPPHSRSPNKPVYRRNDRSKTPAEYCSEILRLRTRDEIDMPSIIRRADCKQSSISSHNEAFSGVTWRTGERISDALKFQVILMCYCRIFRNKNTSSQSSNLSSYCLNYMSKTKNQIF